MSQNVAQFDAWIRDQFKALNTELESLYDHCENPMKIADTGNELKQQLKQEGERHIEKLLIEGNTDQGFDRNFDLLGNIGMYMAACRRHELTEPSRETRSPLEKASALALQVGASLGVTPRFATSHLTTHCKAVDGEPKRFTSLKDEALFIDFNTLAVLAYKRAADALVRILPMGISHPVAPYLLMDATSALKDVAHWNKKLFDELDGDAFFNHVRPYYKPFRVGQHEYRGANAGDFAGINEIDMLLGLCQANQSFYSQLLVDKFLYMMPEDQARLRDVMRRQSLLDQILDGLNSNPEAPWLKEVIRALVEAIDAHGNTAHQHHEQLVKRFIVAPSVKLEDNDKTHITASGPPLEVLLRSLNRLKELRMAANNPQLPSRYHDVQRLKCWLESH